MTKEEFIELHGEEIYNEMVRQPWEPQLSLRIEGLACNLAHNFIMFILKEYLNIPDVKGLIEAKAIIDSAMTFQGIHGCSRDLIANSGKWSAVSDTSLPNTAPFDPPPLSPGSTE